MARPRRPRRRSPYQHHGARASGGRRRGVELQRLQSTVDELTSGRGQILFLLGDSGIGKTRLLTELRTIAGDAVTWLEGRCYSYGTRLLYGPFVQMLRSWIGIDEGEPELQQLFQ